MSKKLLEKTSIVDFIRIGYEMLTLNNLQGMITKLLTKSSPPQLIIQFSPFL